MGISHTGTLIFEYINVIIFKRKQIRHISRTLTRV